jgi:hypothetical protein
MKSDPISGNTYQLVFEDGPMAKMALEHVFDEEGNVTWTVPDADASSAPLGEFRYEVATVVQNVFAVAYLGPRGHTQTTIFDFNSGKVVAFGSSEQALTTQRGTFVLTGAAPIRAQGVIKPAKIRRGDRARPFAV